MIKSWICGLLLGWTSMGMSLAQDAKQVSLVGQLSYNEELNDIWGYVAPNGTEYALVGVQTGVSIVDLSIPAQPAELHFLPGIRSVWRDLKTHGTFAYVSNEEGDGIRIIDLSPLPGQPVYKDTVLENISTTHNVWIDQGFLYLAGPNQFSGGIAIFDLNPDPWRPQFLGAYDQAYVHDVYVRGDTAYAAEIFGGRLSVIDLSNRASPVLLGSTDYLNSFTHNTWLNDSGNVCFTTDEKPAAYIYAWDISDPGNLRQIDSIRASLSQGLSSPHNVHVLNDYIVTSYYRDGIHITDARHPHNLVEVGYYDTSPTLTGPGFDGNWGAYPFLPSGLILASDIEGGLYVLQPTYRRACYLEGKVSNLFTGEALEGVEVSFLTESITDYSANDGQYATGVADSGTYPILFNKFGFRPKLVNATLSNGQVEWLDVGLVTDERTSFSLTVLDAETLAPVPGATVQTIAKGGRAEFSFTTGGIGLVQDPDFVVFEYEIRVGKWGYQPQALSVNVDSNQNQFTVYLEPGYADDFSLDLGWEVTGNARRGIWERAKPIATYRDELYIHNPGADLPNDIGQEAYVTGNKEPGGFGDDVDRGTTSLISPWMDLSDYQEPVIEYAWWFVNWTLEGGGMQGNDFLEVSITDGLDTFAIKTYYGPYDTLWTREQRFFFMKYFDLQTTPVRVIFYTQDLEQNNRDAVEAAIDGFAVVESRLTGIEPESIADFQVYPNPVQESLHMQWQATGLSPTHYRLFSSLGQTLAEQALSPGRTSYELAFPYPPGLYWLGLYAGNRLLGMRKILK